MKKSIWLVLMAVVSASVMAQQVTNTPAAAPMSIPPAPAEAAVGTNAAPSVPTLSADTNAPAKPKANAAKKKKKSSIQKQSKAAPAKPAVAKAPLLKTEPLPPGPATVIANYVNVRGQPRLLGEVVTRLTKGQSVMVLDEITLTNSAPDEPSAWAKIVLPPDRPVWLSSLFVDTNNNVVTATRINLRSGPGENYSVLGRLNRGESFKELDRKPDWIKIEAPTNTYAFVAAQYLRPEIPVAAEVAATPPPAPEPAPAEAPLAEAPAIASAPADAPAVPATEAAAPAPVPAIIDAAPAQPVPAPEPAPEETGPLPKRIVQREGVIKGTVSIQAPSPFCLVNTETGRTIDYLDNPSADFDLRRFKGMRVIVTGEEGLDKRWGNTPVLTIEKLEVLE
jgi:uncharacterized protein YgiM (DUF1202 family)